MKHPLLIFFIFSVISSNCQTISTVAGNGVNAYVGDGGLATNASIGGVGGIVFDHEGNYYIVENNFTIRKISTLGIISKYAGVGTMGYSGDGNSAILAQFQDIGLLFVDSADNLYVSDTHNNRIRKINSLTGIITTVIGNGNAGFSGDGGMATSAEINAPIDVAFDNIGNLFFSDYFNYRIRKVSNTGIISTIAGNGVKGWGNDGIPAIATELEGPYALKTDEEGNVYFSDINRIRKIDKNTGIVSTYVGVIDTSIGSFNCTGDGGLAVNAHTTMISDFIFDKFGNCFISDMNCDKIKIVDKYGYINTFAGTGNETFNGDGEPANSANLYSPRGIAIDSCGNLYISDNGHFRIRQVSFTKCNYLGIINPAINRDISIYPNPTNDLFSIDNLKTHSTYRLLSIIGSVMQQGILKEGNNNISIQIIPIGIYIMEIIDEENNKIMRKIVKQ